MSSSDRPKIFIVEDDFVFYYVLENALKEQENYKIKAFASYEECVSMSMKLKIISAFSASIIILARIGFFCLKT